MHPLRHPRNAVFVGVIFVVIGVVYWALPYFGGCHVDYAGVTMLAASSGSRWRSCPTSSSPARRTTEPDRPRPPTDGTAQNLWNGILELTSQFVIPDWGALIALLPVVHGARRDRLLRLGAGPDRLRTRRRPAAARPDRAAHARRASTCPARRTRRSSRRSARSCCSSGSSSAGRSSSSGVDRPRPDAPLLGPRGAPRLRPRRRATHAGSSRPSSTTGPPPGVHMPGPSFRPFLAALGVVVLFLGLVFGGWVLRSGSSSLIVDAARLAERRPQGVPPDRRGRHDRPPRERARRRRWPKVCSAVW